MHHKFVHITQDISLFNEILFQYLMDDRYIITTALNIDEILFLMNVDINRYTLHFVSHMNYDIHVFIFDEKIRDFIDENNHSYV